MNTDTLYDIKSNQFFEKAPAPELLSSLYKVEIEKNLVSLRSSIQNLDNLSTKNALKQLFSHCNDVPVSCIAISVNGEILNINLMSQVVLNIEKNNAIGRKFKEFIVPQDQNNFDIFLREFFEIELDQTIELELQVEPKPATSLFIQGIYVNTHDFCLLTCIDISVYKLLYNKLNELENESTSLIQKIQAAVVVHGADTSILNYNLKARQLLALSDKQLIGMKASDKSWHFFREDNTRMPVAEYPVNLVISSGKELRDYRVGVLQPNNDIMWALVHADPVFDLDNNIIKVIVTFIDISSQKKIEDALHQSQDRFRRLVDNARDVIYRMSLPDGYYEYISQSALNIFGYSPVEFYRNPFLIKKIIHPDWEKYLERMWAKLLNGQMPPTYEYQIIHKSGEPRWLNQRNILVKDESGEPIAIEGIVSDITSQKEIENTLRINEERYRMAESISHVGNWEYNVKTQNFWGSDEAKRIYGFDIERDEFTTEEVEKCILERGRVHQALIDLIEMEKPYNLEFEINPLNNSEPKTLSSIAELYYDSDGKPLIVKGVVQDITDRHQFMVKLKASEEKFRSLTQTASDAIITSNSKGQIIDWNRGAQEIFGYKYSEIMNKTISILMDKEFWSDLEEIFSNMLLKSESLKRNNAVELEAKHKEGHSFPIELSLSKWKSKDEVYITAIIRDITERKRTEAELMKHQHNLEELVAERTKELELKNKELDEFNSLFIGREFRIKELRDKLKELEAELKSFKGE